ncbi:periplasmic sensor signal transduction histidine kinase [Streptomyces lincolnensis]|uniref:Periplasmic sensor signal transduction histidine kinase n=1 Tax=Streptomyces lincolnensis TaxID=1915 RepID=A0A1B1MHM8_STRLN|nr:sensor histidine kinase [Streptomyces lincolnensis]ANS68098.1 periplasmic sensor signal transduction histidine kinase [Streptomyces lincolnensis]AXG53696.1 periplasmic sensor signal transduction histidine kinase [Streptomyces lincolnensis]QMV09746.1 sensor histidine kinase [Streptomyces lincolnensis]
MTAVDTQIDRRWEQMRALGPYGLLAVGAVLSAGAADLMDGPADWYGAGALVVAAIALQLWWNAVRRRRPDRGRTPSPAGTAYYVVRWVIAFALTWINPLFGFYAATGLMDADELLPGRWRRIGVFAAAVTLAGSQSGGLPPKSTGQWALFAGLIVANAALQLVIAHMVEQEEHRSRERVETITALQQALDENAALHAQLLVQAREAGVADERRRLAAEIHDTIAQGLTGIIAQLQVVANTPDENQAREHVGRAMDLARHSLGEARRSVHNLAPVALSDAGLPQALKATVTDWGERTDIRAEFTVTGATEQLHDEVAATLLRIAQEALSNAARHARATRLGVTLTFLGDEVILDIRDDGVGFDPLTLPPRTHAGGFGLDGMRARAERIAGALTVESEPGHGTAVSARVPLVRHDQ